MTQQNIATILKPNKDAMRQHVEFIMQGMGDYQDGQIEIAYGDEENVPRHAEKFTIDRPEDVGHIVDFAYDTNAKGKNIYIVGSYLVPSAPMTGRSNDTQFYATSTIWCDIDDPITPAELKERYKDTPPSLVVVTGRQPHIRTHLWWKLLEPITDAQELRKTLIGVIDHMGGDPSAKNPSRLMRLGGSIAWPKKEGRIAEMTEVKVTAGIPVSVETLQRVYPVKAKSSALTNNITNLTPQSGNKITGLMLSNHTWTLEQVAEMMKYLDPDMPYHEWLKVGMALHQGGHPFSLWDDWSRKGAKYQKGDCDYRWRGFKHNGGVSFGTIVYTAKEHGWRNDNVKREPVETAKTLTIKEININPETGEVIEFNLNDWIASNRYTGEAKPIQWLVKGVFPVGVPVLLAAMGGLGKSFIALDMCIKIASPPRGIAPEQVLGHEVLEHGKAILITAEDSFDSIHRRINKLVSPEKLQATLDNLIIVPMSELDISQLLVKQGKDGIETTDFFQTLKHQLLTTENVKVVVIDPLQAFVGADITSKPEDAQFMWSAFSKIASQAKVTMIATHHMRKDGNKEIKTLADAREGIRGVTALVDGARVAYVLWQATKDIGKALATRIGKDFTADRFVQGGVVKANDEANKEVMTFYREDNGLLSAQGFIDTAGVKIEGVLTPLQREIYDAIVDALTDKGRMVLPYPNGKQVKAVSYDDLYERLEARGYRDFTFTKKEEDDQDARARKIKNNTSNARVALKDKGKIGYTKKWLWIMSQELESEEIE